VGGQESFKARFVYLATLQRCGRTRGLILITPEEVDKNSCNLTSVKLGVHLVEAGLSNMLPQCVVCVGQVHAGAASALLVLLSMSYIKFSKMQRYVTLGVP
jgi:hypothetical protein